MWVACSLWWVPDPDYKCFPPTFPCELFTPWQSIVHEPERANQLLGNIFFSLSSDRPLSYRPWSCRQVVWKLGRGSKESTWGNALPVAPCGLCHFPFSLPLRGHYLFREANSFPRATLLGTDNVRGQISEHISARNGSFCFFIRRSVILIHHWVWLDTVGVNFYQTQFFFNQPKTNTFVHEIISSCMRFH